MIKEYEFADHEEWLKIRSQYIGGSDASAVIGMNPWRSAYALWAEKTGKVPGFEGNLTTTAGAYLEDLVAKLFEDETGKKVRRKNRTLVNEEYPFACANVDRLVIGEDAGLEIKTTNSFPIMRQLRGNEFPDAYYAQCVHYLAVTGKAKWYLAVLINCREFKVYELERDQAEIDALMSAEKEFWGHVEGNIPPMVDGSESTADTLKLLYPESDGSTVDLTMFQADLIEYQELQAQMKALKELADEKANRIKEYMQGAAKGICGATTVSYSSMAGRQSFDYKLLMKDRPDMDFSMYLKTGDPYRVFKVTTKKEVK